MDEFRSLAQQFRDMTPEELQEIASLLKPYLKDDSNA